MEWFTLSYIFFFFIVNPLSLLPYSLDSWILFFLLSSDSRRLRVPFWSPFRVGLYFLQCKKMGFGLVCLLSVVAVSFGVSGLRFFLSRFSPRGLFIPASLRFVAIYISFISMVPYLLDYRRSPILPVWGLWCIWLWPVGCK